MAPSATSVALTVNSVIVGSRLRLSDHMDIVYMGTPAFACPALAALHDSRHTVLAVVTGRDKPAGRGRRLLSTPVKRAAMDRSIPVMTPKSLKSSTLREDLAALNPDLFVVIAFRILPEALFSVPRRGSINVHASLLPKYRGAAPIHWALINGESETGLSSFFLKPSVDTGDVIAQEPMSVMPEDTYDTLSERLSLAAGPFLLRTLDRIESDQANPIPQDDNLASPAPKISSEDALIDFGFPAQLVCNFIRGLASKPGAYTYFNGRTVKVLGCRTADDIELQSGCRPGQLLPHKKRLLVACANSAVELTRLVPEGTKEMDGLSFKNGFRLQPEDVFGNSHVGDSHKS